MGYPQPPVDSVKIKSTLTYSSIIDGWGTITTPAYSNVNAIRQKRTENRVDSTFIRMGGNWIPQGSPSYDSTIQYQWWTNTLKYPVAEVSADGNNVVDNASYLSSSQVGVIEKNKSGTEITIYPNPASDKLFIGGINENSYIVIFDATGKLMSTSLLKKNYSTINIASYENGMYFYQAVDMGGNILSRGKFAVVNNLFSPVKSKKGDEIFTAFFYADSTRNFSSLSAFLIYLHI